MARRRDHLPRGLAALGVTLFSVPFIALVLLLAVTMPRCFFDADPFLGAHGYVLCPERCDDCRGPLRVYTEWHHNGGEHTTNGPQYFCRTPTNRVATMSDQEMDGRLHELEPYELDWAPAAATYMTLVLLLVPLAAIRAISVNRRAERQAADLEEEMATIARSAGLAVPAGPLLGGRSGVGMGLMALAGSLLLPLAIIALELALR
ncbi:MAG: hypothetical protein WKG00_20475 [Polyangiaceae bacterium]